MKRIFSLDVVSTYRAPIYGICIFWIVFYHAAAIDKVDYTFGMASLDWLQNIVGHGSVGVDAFLLLSGISLYYSWHRNPNVGEYFTKRFVRLFVPLLVIDGLYWFIRCIVLGQLDGISGFIRRIAMVSLWTDGTASTWYVELMLVLYLIYPFVHEFIFHDDDRVKTTARAVLLIGAAYLVVLSFWDDNPDVYNMSEIALTRIPVFLLGCAMGRAVYRGVKLPAWCAIVPIVGTIVFFFVISGDYVVLEKPWRRFFYLVGGVSLAYTFALAFMGIDKLFGTKRRPLVLRGLDRLGDASLELYLMHIMFNQVYRKTPLYTEGDFLGYCVMAVLAIAAALLVSKYIVKPLSKRVLAAAKKRPAVPSGESGRSAPAVSAAEGTGNATGAGAIEAASEQKPPTNV